MSCTTISAYAALRSTDDGRRFLATQLAEALQRVYIERDSVAFMLKKGDQRHDRREIRRARQHGRRHA